MKKIYLLLFPIFLFSSCFTEYFGEPVAPYSEYKPILADRATLKKSVQYEASRTLCNPGKFYIRGNQFFIIEKYEGIHVFDNSDQTNPHSVGFIPVLGCVDIAMKGNYLYVDSSIDLLTIDFSNGLENLKVSNRIENIFPEGLPPDGRDLRPEYEQVNRPANTVLVGWEKIINNN